MKQKRLLTLLALGVGGFYAWQYFKQRQVLPGQTPGQPTNGKVQRTITAGGNLIEQFVNLVNAIRAPRVPANGNGTIREDLNNTEIAP